MLFPIVFLPKRMLVSLNRFWFGGVALIPLLVALPAQAQVGLSPLVIELQSERGQAEGVINVINNTNEEFRARIYVEPFTYTREDGFETLESDPDDLTPYLQFSPRELAVPPNTTRRVRFISRFAPGMPQGEYRAVIFTESLQEVTASNGTQVDLRTRIGATVYIRNGDLSPVLEASGARYDGEDKQVQLLVQNTGPASARTQIAWELSQGGQVVRSGLTGEASVIAETERYLKVLDFAHGDEPLAPGNYQINGELRWLGPDQNVVTTPFSADFTIPAS